MEQAQSLQLSGTINSSSSQLIFKKMVDIMCDIGHVGKDQTNTIQKFNFRGIDQFINALNPVLQKHRVFIVPKCISESHEIREVTRSNGKLGVDKHVQVQMQYTFCAEDGSTVAIGPIVGEGLDSGDKATAKALSAAMKVMLIQTFCIATEDMTDGDSESPEIEPPSSRETPSQYYRKNPSEFKPNERELLTKRATGIYNSYMAKQPPEFKFKEMLKARFGTEETLKLTVEQLKIVVEEMEQIAKGGAIQAPKPKPGSFAAATEKAIESLENISDRFRNKGKQTEMAVVDEKYVK